jgi:creatinine amidohydrolase
MTPRPYVLAETNWKAVKETPFEVAILPWGATEPHNFHLPYGTDNYESVAIAERAAEIAWTQGAKVVVLPTVPFGVNTGQLDLRLAINMNPSTQLAVLTDIATALSGQGVRKLLILNSHGGNDFRQMIRELQPRVKLFICTINWWTCVKGSDYFDEPGDHAGEMETSLMMALHPDLLLPLSEAVVSYRGHVRDISPRCYGEGWRLPRRPCEDRSGQHVRVSADASGQEKKRERGCFGF